MVKEVKTSPPNKWGNAPAIIKDENSRFHETCDETVRKFAGVQIVSSPYRVTEEYRKGYDEINWGHHD